MDLPFDRLEDVLEEYVPKEKLAEVKRRIYGDRVGDLELPIKAYELANQLDMELRASKFPCAKEQTRPPRLVRVGLLQHRMPQPACEPIEKQRQAAHHRVKQMLEVAALAKVNVVCLEEIWTMPYAPVTQEKMPWGEFAENAEQGPTTSFLKTMAARHQMLIISPMLERDENHGDVLWNTAVFIGPEGRYLGKTRKNHIPCSGTFPESIYYNSSDLGHPVFDTVFGKIGVSICYDRHHPQCWWMFGLNGAEMVFNPSASIGNGSEVMWPVTARNAAWTNSYFTFSLNRVGLDVMPNEFTTGDGRLARREFGPFYGSSYATAPSGSRTPALSRVRDGLLVVELDRNQCRQAKDDWGLRMTQRLEYYAKALNDAADPNYKPQVIDAK